MFILRATVARHYGGTPFDPKYLQMPFEQLVILGHEARRHLESEQTTRVEIVKNVAVAAQRFFEQEFSLLRGFTNTELYQKIEKAKDMKQYEKELPPEKVKEEFEKIEEMGLDELEVEMPEQPPEEVDPLAEEIVNALGATGFEEFSASFLTAQADLADIDLEEE